jgi:hypothetical protein
MCPLSPLDEVIRRRAEQLRAEAANDQVDWDERRAWWQKRTNELYEQIRGWFQPLIDEKIVEFKLNTAELREERIGTYSIDALTLSIDACDLDVVPVGTIVIGGFGRADVTGRAGRAMLILAATDDKLPMPDRRNTAQWCLVRPDDRAKLAPISEEIFKQIFTDLMSLSR